MRQAQVSSWCVLCVCVLCVCVVRVCVVGVCEDSKGGEGRWNVGVGEGLKGA